MSSYRYGMTAAVKEHLAEGKPISRLEALALYGVANLTDVVSELKKQGWVIDSRRVPFPARRIELPLRSTRPNREIWALLSAIPVATINIQNINNSGEKAPSGGGPPE